MTANGLPVIDTGPGGGLVFGFTWTNTDPLSLSIAPLRYGRVDIDAGDGLVEGVIREVEPVLDDQNEAIEGVYDLIISVGMPEARMVKRAIDRGEIAVRVRS